MWACQFFNLCICAVCVKGGFQLTKWISNRHTVLAAIPQEERSMEVKTGLGQWLFAHRKQLWVYPMPLSLRSHSGTDLWQWQGERFCLCIISSIYDTFGFLTPFKPNTQISDWKGKGDILAVKGKMIMGDVWIWCGLSISRASIFLQFNPNLCHKEYTHTLMPSW